MHHKYITAITIVLVDGHPVLDFTMTNNVAKQLLKQMAYYCFVTADGDSEQSRTSICIHYW